MFIDSLAKCSMTGIRANYNIQPQIKLCPGFK